MLGNDQLTAVGRHLCGVLGVTRLEIANLKRFHGGASRETYAFDAVTETQTIPLILRKDPVDSLIDTARALEFAAYRSMAGTGVPVPSAVSLVEDASLIGAAFFIMERIDGGAAVSPFVAQGYGEHGAVIGEQFFRHLGAIHAVSPESSPLAKVVDTPAPDACWRRELDYWEATFRKDALAPEPIGMAAIRWLRANPPPPAQRLSIVHGDYRNGNVLHDGHGRIIAVLDWEMAHIGDPYEDLGWALDPLWTMLDDTKAAGLIPRAEAIALWEAASGCRFDPAAFRWWEVFAAFKGLAIWTTSARAFIQAANTDPVLAFSALYPKVRSNAILARYLTPEARA